MELLESRLAPASLGGVSICSADLNHDGYADVITGAGPGSAPVVKVFSGKDGTLLFNFLAYEAAFTGGVQVAVGDVNGDGTLDIITGTWSGAPHVKVFSGRDGTLLQSFFAYDPALLGGISVAAADFNHDGHADIVTGAGDGAPLVIPGPHPINPDADIVTGAGGGAPHVKVFSGADNSLLLSFMAYAPAFQGGVHVGAGDVNGDGTPEIITGAGPGGLPEVKVFSSQSVQLRDFLAFDPAFQGGVYVAAGNINGTGYADIIAGAGAGGLPLVTVFPGLGMSAPHAFLAYDAAFRGGVTVADPDLNGDGHDDIVTGTASGSAAHIKAFSGVDDSTLVSFFAYGPGSGTGGFSQPVNSVVDTQPPIVVFTSPPAGRATQENITLTGQVTDDLSGVASLQAQVDGGAFVGVPFDAAGNFQFTTTLPLDGTADGSHTVSFQATDEAGNSSAPVVVSFTLQTLLPPLAKPRLDPAGDTGSSNTDNITRDTTPTVLVDAPSGLAVSLLLNGQLAQQAVAVNGTASFVLAPLADGSYNVTAAVLSSTGIFDRTSDPLALMIDTRPPATPTFELAAGTADQGPETTSAARVSLVGHTDPGATLTLAGTALTAQASGTGTFLIPNVNLAAGANMLSVQAVDIAGNSSSASLTVTRGTPATGPNAVIVWNQATLNAIQTDGTDPVMASRALAMVQAAVYDAVNNVQGTPAYYVKLTAPADASVNAAVAAAAHDVLVYLYPAQQATFDALLTSQLALLPSGQGTTDGETVGQAVGNAIIALRANDGSTQYVDFEPGTATGDWQPTAPMYAPALDPQWANLKPWALTSPNQFDPAGPPALTSQQWADAVNQVESLGAVTGSTRTAAQTTLAQFWNDGLGTDTPSGHWNAIAQTVAQQEGDSLADDARLFAELDVSMADAGIATWNTKYLYDTWRPITVIQGGGDGVNPAVTADPTWLPLLNTPNFPEYTSGHSAFSMAAATVLDSVFGANVSFTTTEPTTALSLTYTSFDQAAQDAGMSRLYGGIHFLFSIQDGWTVGQEVANWDLATFHLSQDTTPPSVTLNNVLPSGASKTNVTISGQVTDNLSGVARLQVQIDNGSYAPLAFDAPTGKFSFTTSFALNGSADGSHTINFQAADAAGNVAAAVPFTFVLGTQAPVLTLTSPSDGGTLTVAADVTGTVTTSGAALAALSYAFAGGQSMPVAFTPDTGAAVPSIFEFDQALDLSHLAAGAHTLTVTATDAAGNSVTQTLHLTQAAPIPLQLTSITPMDGSTDVGVSFRPKATFSRPIQTTTLTSANFHATDASGAVLPSTIVPADDGTYAWLFFTNPLPGGSTITLTVDGSTIKAADGTLLDAADTGTPGSKSITTFTTVSTTPVPGTTLAGIVADPGPDDKPMTRDDVRAGADGVLGTGDDIYLRPIQGVKVYILGQENQAVYTDSQGRFSFSSVPSGDVKLAVEGNVPGVMVYDPNQQRFVDPGSEGFYFPQMTMDLTIQPGVANTVMGSMGTTEEQAANATNLGVYLPRIQTSILQTVSATQPTTVGITGPSGLGLTPQQQSELTLTVQPGSAIGLDGQKLTSFQVGISTVPPQIVMDMLPAGVMQHTFDITIQAPGVATFSTPATLTFPNVFNAAPGTQLDVLSFDHTTGRLVIDGTATVSADGLTVVSDPGSGVTQAGWHGLTPPGGCGASGGPPPAPPPKKPKPPPPPPPPVPLAFISGESGSFGLSWNDPKKPNQPQPMGPAGACTPQHDPKPPKPVVVTIDVDGPLAAFLTSTGTQPFGHSSFEIGAGTGNTYTLSGSAKTYDQMFGSFLTLQNDRLYGARITVSTTSTDDQGNTTTTIQTYLIYRWIDVVDATQAINHTGTTAAFMRTLVGTSRTKVIDVFTGGGETTTFLSGDPTQFSTPGNTWTFTPDGTGVVDPNAALIKSSTSVNIRASVTVSGTPFTVTVGQVTAIGSATKPTTIGVNVSAYEAKLSQVILGLQDIKDADGNQEYITYKGMQVPKIAYKTGGAGSDVAAGLTFLVSPTFQKEFADYLPDQWSGLINNGGLPAKLLSFNAFLDQEGAALLAAVQNDFKNIPGITVVAGSGDINYKWVDAINQTTGGRTAANEPNESYLKTYLSFDARLPLASQVYALAEGLNQLVKNAPTDDVAVASKLGTLDDNAPGLITFSQVVGRTFSHEVGHTFGLNDAYYYVTGPDGNQYGQPTNPFDIMSSMPAAPTLWNLSFAPQSVELLEDAVGSEGAFSDLAIHALELLKSNFNHANSNDPLLEVNQVADAPQLLLQRNDQTFFSGDADSFGTVPTNNSGAVQQVYTLENVGTAPLTISSVALSNGTQGFALVGASLAGTVIQPGDSVNVTVQFDPTTVGAHQDQLSITSDADASPTFALSVSGNAIALAPTARLTLANNNFGGVSVGTTSTLSNLATITNDGMQPLTISAISVEAGTSSYTLIGVPADLAAHPITLAHGQSFSFGVQYTASTALLERATIDVATNDPHQPLIHFGVTGTGLDDTIQPHWGHDFVAIEFPASNTPVLRAISDDSGNFSLFLPPNQRYHLAIFDPVTGQIAHGYGVTPASGGMIDLTGNLVFEPSTAPDTDGDGLPDDVEFAVGTNPNKVFTAGDGIDDFTHVILNHTDPLAGRGLPTGIIASLSLAGDAKAITIQGSTTNPLQQTAYVATGSYGLAIVDATQFNKPILLGQIQLPGDSQGVDVDPTAQIAAVAAGSAGLHLVDVSNPMQPVLRHIASLAGGANAVTELDGLAYVASGPSLVSIDTATGEVVQTLNLGGSSLISLAREGSRLFTLDASRTLRAVTVDNGFMTARGSLALPIGGGQLFVGNGIAYIGAGNSFGEGFATADVSDPDQLMTLSAPQLASVGGQMVVANGSGLALAVGSPTLAAGGSFVPTPVLDVMDVSNPANTGQFVTQFALPVSPFAVAIASGIGYVADGTGGLLVANYAPFDTRGVPPTVSISSSVADADPSTPGIQVAAGTVVPIRVDTSDDVQVRNVELLLNGKVIRNQVSFPYDLTAVLPSAAAVGTVTPVTLQVRVTDTGGNSTLSNVLTLQSLPDTVPPTIVGSTPADGGQVGQSIRIDFSKPLAAASVTTDNFQLLDSADHPVPGVIAGLRNGDQTVQLAFGPLKSGSYHLVLDTAAITDRAGNPVGGPDVTLHFTPVAGVSIIWINPKGGDWSDPANWDTGVVPGPTDDVLIDVPGNVPITFSTGTVQINSLLSRNPFTITGGTLKVAHSIEVDNTFTLAGGTLDNTGGTLTLNGALGSLTVAGGTLEGGTLTASGGAKVVVTGAGSVLDGVTLNADLDLTAAGASATVQNGLTLNGTARIGDPNGLSSAGLTFNGDQTLGGTGTVLFGSASNSFFGISGSTLTIGSGITIGGTTGLVGPGAVVNQGTIQADGSGSAIALTLASFTNQGTLAATNGGSLSVTGLSGSLGTVMLSGANSKLSVTGSNYTVDSSLSITNGQTLALLGSWTAGAGVTLTATGATFGLGNTTSLSAISLTNSLLNLFGQYTTAQFQPLLAGNALSMTTIGQGGVLDNTGDTLTLTSTTGSLTLAGGTLEGGTVDASGGAKVVVVAPSSNSSIAVGQLTGSVLDGVTLNADLDLTASGASATVQNGLTLNGTALVGAPNGPSAASLTFNGNQTLDGTGTVLFGRGSSDPMHPAINSLFIASGNTLTIGSGITIGGGMATIAGFSGFVVSNQAPQGAVVNQGTIDADGSGSTIVVTLASFTNQGTLAATNGGSLSVTGLSGSLGTVVLSGANSKLSVTGSNYTVDSSLSITNGQTLALLGSWTAGAGVTLTATGATFGLGNTTSLSAISLTNSLLTVNGTYTIAQLQPLLAGNTLTIGLGGRLDNTGNTITLDATTGSLTLAGGTLKGGTVTASSGAKVIVIGPTGSGSSGVSSGIRPLPVIGGGGSGSTSVNVLDGVTLNADLDLTAAGAGITVQNGLTLNGTALVGDPNAISNASLIFNGNQTLGGTGTVLFGLGSSDPLHPSTNSLFVVSGNTLTIGSGITIGGASGTIAGRGSGVVVLNQPLGAVVNQGTIDADGSGSTIVVTLASFTNQGTLAATNGGSLSITGLSGSLGTVVLSGANSRLSVSGSNYTVDSSVNIPNGTTLALLGSWTAGAGVTLTATGGTFGLGNTTSLSAISLTNSLLTVNGAYTIAQLQPLLAGNTLAIGRGGTVDNTGNTLTLDDTTGSLTLAGGTLEGGTVNASGSAKVVVVAAPPDTSSTFISLLPSSVLDGVTLNADLDLTAVGAGATVQNGLTLNGTARIGDPAGLSTAGLFFNGNQTLSGTGTIQFGTASTPPLNQLFLSGGTTLTIASGITLTGGTGQVSAATLVDQGTIHAGSGQLNFLGDVTQSATSATTVDLDGSMVGSVGRIIVNGNASLNGTLNLVRVNGYMPSVGDTFRILDAGARMGQFAILNGTATGNGHTFVVSYDSTGVTVTVV